MDELKNIDFKKLTLWYLPSWIRTNGVVLMVYAAILPVIRLSTMLQSYFAAKVYRLNHNSQICYLEAVLRDVFDADLRRIYISDFDGKNRIYFWPELDRRDVNFEENQYFWSETDYGDSGVDFSIHVPQDAAVGQAQEAYLRSLADEYKLAGKQYNVIRF